MKSTRTLILKIALALMVLIGVVACASAPKQFEYHDDREEKPGPGLFSGEDGGLIIPGKPEAKRADGENANTGSP